MFSWLFDSLRPESGYVLNIIRYKDIQSICSKEIRHTAPQIMSPTKNYHAGMSVGVCDIELKEPQKSVELVHRILSGLFWGGPGCSSRGPFEDFSISEDVYAAGLGERMNMTLEKNKMGVDASLLQQEILKNSDISRRPMLGWCRSCSHNLWCWFYNYEQLIITCWFSPKFALSSSVNGGSSLNSKTKRQHHAMLIDFHVAFSDPRQPFIYWLAMPHLICTVFHPSKIQMCLSCIATGKTLQLDGGCLIHELMITVGQK